MSYEAISNIRQYAWRMMNDGCDIGSYCRNLWAKRPAGLRWISEAAGKDIDLVCRPGEVAVCLRSLYDPACADNDAYDLVTVPDDFEIYFVDWSEDYFSFTIQITPPGWNVPVVSIDAHFVYTSFSHTAITPLQPE